MARSLSALKDARTFSSWLYRIVTNQSISAARKLRPTVPIDAAPECGTQFDSSDALDLYNALRALDAITGATTTDDIRPFSVSIPRPKFAPFPFESSAYVLGVIAVAPDGADENPLFESITPPVMFPPPSVVTLPTIEIGAALVLEKSTPESSNT